MSRQFILVCLDVDDEENEVIRAIDKVASEYEMLCDVFHTYSTRDLVKRVGDLMDEVHNPRFFTRREWLPAHWASALINGDESGLEDDEVAELNEYLEGHPEHAQPTGVSERTEIKVFHWTGQLTEMARYDFLYSNPNYKEPPCTTSATSA